MVVATSRWLLFGSMLSILFAAGCSGNTRVPTELVQGTIVSEDGRPIALANIVLHPVETKTEFPKPRGTTDAEGTFKLSTYDTEDGAPQGKYRVTLERWFRDEPDSPPTNHLSTALATPATAGIEIQITKGPNRLDPIKVR